MAVHVGLPSYYFVKEVGPDVFFSVAGVKMNPR